VEDFTYVQNFKTATFSFPILSKKRHMFKPRPLNFYSTLSRKKFHIHVILSRSLIVVVITVIRDTSSDYNE